jgi:hypothetical protein
MKHTFSIPLAIGLFAVLPGIAFSQAPPDSPKPAKKSVNDWRRVQDRMQGEELYLQSTDGSHMLCRFAGATEEAIFCGSIYGGTGEDGYRLDRADVKAIRLEPQPGRWNIKKAVGVGAAAGFAFGLIVHPASDPNPRVFDGIGMGAVGALAGLLVSSVGAPISALVNHSTLIYRQPRQERKPRVSAQLAPRQINPNTAATELSESSQPR